MFCAPSPTSRGRNPPRPRTNNRPRRSSSACHAPTAQWASHRHQQPACARIQTTTAPPHPTRHRPRMITTMHARAHFDCYAPPAPAPVRPTEPPRITPVSTQRHATHSTTRYSPDSLVLQHQPSKYQRLRVHTNNAITPARKRKRNPCGPGHTIFAQLDVRANGDVGAVATRQRRTCKPGTTTIRIRGQCRHRKAHPPHSQQQHNK